MSDLPRRSVVRGARLAALPAGLAGRTALGLGKRLGGRPAEIVAAEVSERTAQQVFRVLGELKGGAMKVGQALSVLEAALPETMVGPYRAALTRLQDSAPPMPASTVRHVLATELGPRWARRLAEFDDTAAAAASIGQVHRATWRGPGGPLPVAVKIQYPGAGEALLSDLTQIGRLARVIGTVVPGLEIKPVVTELRERMAEELDYLHEGDAQRRFAAAFRDDPHVLVPRVLTATPHVLVTEWVQARGFADVIATGTGEERDLAGNRLVEFLFAAPARARALHADPHPGNFQLHPDGRLVVFDFGSVTVLPHGLPPAIGRLLTIAMEGDAETVLRGLQAEGFVRPRARVTADALMGYLAPFVDPVRTETFTFTREWLRGQAVRVTDLRNPQSAVGLQLNLPPEYLSISRVWLGGLGILTQLGATGGWRAILHQWLPGFDPGKSALAP
ncbi:MAG: ABC1 kinase family protein [Actinomycetes bacterium]